MAPAPSSASLSARSQPCARTRVVLRSGSASYPCLLILQPVRWRHPTLASSSSLPTATQQPTPHSSAHHGQCETDSHWRAQDDREHDPEWHQETWEAKARTLSRESPPELESMIVDGEVDLESYPQLVWFVAPLFS
jgi:hypothetical protein